MLTVAVLQQKGGSGKTTLAINLAAAAHLEGDRALVVDMDRQASAFDWSAARQDGSPLDGLAVVKADRAIALPRFKEIARGYDYVFLDGPPRLGDVTQSAAVAADVAVMPIQPGPFDFWAVAETLESLDQADQVREQLGRPLIRRVFVLNRASTNTRLAREAEAELRKAGELAGVVHQRIAFPDAASRGESVLTSPATSLAADDIRPLWRRLKGGKHGSEPQETKPGTKREAHETRSRRSSATARSGSSRTCLSTSTGRCA
jgi:chromosome partitioning protein